MSEHVEGLNRNQTALFTETLEGYVDKENPVRFMNAFVDSLNLEKLGFKHTIPAEFGRPPTTLQTFLNYTFTDRDCGKNRILPVTLQM